jgi:hypothetical protein
MAYLDGLLFSSLSVWACVAIIHLDGLLTINVERIKGVCVCV